MTSSEVNTATLVEMSVLIEQLTTSGKSTLDDKITKQLKKICRQSDGYVKQAYHLTMAQLEKGHSEIRLSAAQVMNELFERSHFFREMLLASFQHFMELALETDLKKPLPPPVRAAAELKKQSARFVHNWFTKFSDTYKQLALGYNFLTNCKKVDFANIQTQTLAERQLKEEQQAKQELRLHVRANIALDEMNEMACEICSCITMSKNCMNLLVPDPYAFDILEIDSTHATAFEFKNDEQKLHTKSSLASNNTSSVGDNVISDSTVDNKRENSALVIFSEDKSTETSAHSGLGIFSGSASAIAAEGSSVLEESLPPNEDKDDKNSDSEQEQEDSEDDEDVYDSENTSRLHGILNGRTAAVNITINQKSVALRKTADNVNLIATLSEQVSVARNKWLPLVKKWLDVLTKAAGNDANMRSALDLKMDLESMVKKANKLNISSITPSSSQPEQEDSSDDDDFVEVPAKEGYEPFLPNFLREEHELGPRHPVKPQAVHGINKNVQCRKNIEFDTEDPTTWAATLKKLKEETKKNRITLERNDDEPQPSTSKDDPAASKNHNELLQKAPVIPYGADLYHWGDEFAAPLVIRNNTESLRWWSNKEAEDTVDTFALSAIKQRTINFTGKFEPVKWHCRTPLSNGKLCIRMDRYKCPFHGKIIPRDKQGTPNGPEKVEMPEENIFEQKSNGWDDPELQADIFAATGIDLSLKKKGKGKKGERKYPNLTDIKSLKKNTARKRLGTKIFSNAAVKRVAESLDDIDAKRHRDKFSNNFNYSCQM